MRLVTNLDAPLETLGDILNFQHIWRADAGLGDEIKVVFQNMDRDHFVYTCTHDGDELFRRDLYYVTMHMTERRIEIDIDTVLDLFGMTEDERRKKSKVILKWYRDAEDICKERSPFGYANGPANGDVILTLH